MHEAGNTLDQIFKLFVEISPEERGTSRTSIYRHLTHCLQPEGAEDHQKNVLNNLSLRLEELNQTKPSLTENDVYSQA